MNEAMTETMPEAAESLHEETKPIMPTEAPVEEGPVENEEPEETGEDSEERSGELDALREKVASLERELRERDAQYARVSAEARAFEENFPGVTLHDVPEKVWDTVHSGIPLMYAYAFYESMENRRRAGAEACNERNAQKSPGLPEPSGARLYSPAEVRAMSRSQVRENYDRIFESMRHWQ